MTRAMTREQYMRRCAMAWAYRQGPGTNAPGPDGRGWFGRLLPGEPWQASQARLDAKIRRTAP